MSLTVYVKAWHKFWDNLERRPERFWVALQGREYGRGEYGRGSDHGRGRGDHNRGHEPSHIIRNPAHHQSHQALKSTGPNDFQEAIDRKPRNRGWETSRPPNTGPQVCLEQSSPFWGLKCFIAPQPAHEVSCGYTTLAFFKVVSLKEDPKACCTCWTHPLAGIICQALSFQMLETQYVQFVIGWEGWTHNRGQCPCQDCQYVCCTHHRGLTSQKLYHNLTSFVCDEF